MQNNIKCPSCNSDCYFCYDEWGLTPWHLHCDTCRINIGTSTQKKAIELLQKYNKKDTYLEFYNDEIIFLVKEGVKKIYAK